MNQPPCDFCSGESIGVKKYAEELAKVERAVVDGPTRLGPWANMCKRHLKIAGYPKSEMNHSLKGNL